MEFGWINVFCGIIVALMLIPNIVYAVRCPQRPNSCKNRWINLLEQVGRYASMAFMVLPIGVWKFSFSGVKEMLLCLFGNPLLLIAYWCSWGGYFRSASQGFAWALVVLPTCIFLLNGILLRHWLLAAAAVLFGIGHSCVTAANRNHAR